VKFSDIIPALYKGEKVSRKAWHKEKLYAELTGHRLYVYCGDMAIAEILNRDFYADLDDWYIIGQETAEDLPNDHNRQIAERVAEEAGKAMQNEEYRKYYAKKGKRTND
jgi:hypothetical protein